MNPVMMNLFGIEIKWYSFFIMVGMIIGIFLITKEAKKFGIRQDTVFDLCFYTIIIGILGARLYYVLFNISYYKYNLTEIFAIWNGGLAIHGGLIAGFVTIYIYCKRNNLSLMRILDIIAPAVILAQGIGRWGNFFNSEAHGFATTYANLKSLFVPEFIIKGMQINGVYYLPTFYFEFLWCFLGFIILLVLRKFRYIKVGTIASIYLMWYGFGRFFIEAWRTDSLMIGGFKIAQIISLIIFGVGLGYIIYNSKKNKYEDLYNDINERRI